MRPYGRDARGLPPAGQHSAEEKTARKYGRGRRRRVLYAVGLFSFFLVATYYMYAIVIPAVLKKPGEPVSSNVAHRTQLAPSKGADVFHDDSENVWEPSTACDWESDDLAATCVGLHLVPDIKSVHECEQRCCSLPYCMKKDTPVKECCSTFQWHETKGCFSGQPVRFGMERRSTEHWCEPTVPKRWTGARLAERSEGAGTCTWGEELPSQCFNLGIRVEEASSAAQCRELLCAGKLKPEADVYQYREDKGCFIGRTTHCDADVLRLQGRRKVAPEGAYA